MVSARTQSQTVHAEAYLLHELCMCARDGACDGSRPGDLQRYVAISSKRFHAVEATSDSLRVSVIGIRSESLSITALRPRPQARLPSGSELEGAVGRSGNAEWEVEIKFVEFPSECHLQPVDGQTAPACLKDVVFSDNRSQRTDADECCK